MTRTKWVGARKRSKYVQLLILKGSWCFVQRKVGLKGPKEGV